VDVVYTTRWQTTGTEKKDPHWRDIFKDYAVTAKLMNKYPHAVFMHDLPAHRGEEVEEGVLESVYSIAFTQAENKLHGAKAVLEWCINPA
jgi:ornithine carbamoyltransferase